MCGPGRREARWKGGGGQGGREGGQAEDDMAKTQSAMHLYLGKFQNILMKVGGVSCSFRECCCIVLLDTAHLDLGLHDL